MDRFYAFNWIVAYRTFEYKGTRVGIDDNGSCANHCFSMVTISKE